MVNGVMFLYNGSEGNNIHLKFIGTLSLVFLLKCMAFLKCTDDSSMDPPKWHIQTLGFPLNMLALDFHSREIFVYHISMFLFEIEWALREAVTGSIFSLCFKKMRGLGNANFYIKNIKYNNVLIAKLEAFCNALNL